MGITCEALDKEISALKAGKMTWDTVKQLNLLFSAPSSATTPVTASA